jgi:Uma2 family endonuclease
VIKGKVEEKSFKMAQSNYQYLTVEEYLWQEQRAEVKHDYQHGQAYNMAGGSPEHSQIAVNLTGELRTRLRGQGCQVFNSDLKIGVGGNLRVKGQKRLPNDEFITYPDASVVCGQFKFYKDDHGTLANPTVLFEVLSPSTRNYDRSIKLEYYRKLPDLLAYIMIDSERIWVEQYHRATPNSWQVDTPLEELKATLRIEALNIEIPLTVLYEGIQFEELDSDD